MAAVHSDEAGRSRRCSADPGSIGPFRDEPGEALPAPPDLGKSSPADDTAQRLLAEFTGAVDLPTIRVLLACGRDLAGSPSAALPELVERLARQDLVDLIARRRSVSGAPELGRGGWGWG